MHLKKDLITFKSLSDDRRKTPIKLTKRKFLNVRSKFLLPLSGGSLKQALESPSFCQYNIDCATSRIF